MLTWVYGHIGYILLALFAVCTIRSISLKSTPLIVCCVALGIEVMGAWLSPWQAPEKMVIAHLFALVVVLFLLHGLVRAGFGALILGMMVADTYFALSLSGYVLDNYALFPWRSTLNLLFLMQCFFLLYCTNKKTLSRITEENGHADFLAREIAENRKPHNGP